MLIVIPDRYAIPENPDIPEMHIHKKA